jgi:hypothetical protein
LRTSSTGIIRIVIKTITIHWETLFIVENVGLRCTLLAVGTCEVGLAASYIDIAMRVGIIQMITYIAL